MNRKETAHLLGVIALSDRRELSDELTKLWHAILANIDINDALAAVLKHRAESTEWLQAAHIVRAVRAERAKRIETANLVYEPNDEETARDFCLRLAAMNRAAADGTIAAGPIRRMLEPVPSAGAPLEIKNAVEQLRAGRAALAVTCPHCGATPGSRCTANTKRHRAPHGGTYQARDDAYRVRHAAEATT